MSKPSSGFSGWRHLSSPYDVLGVSSFASNAEIRRAYRKRALETHPDKQYQFGATEEEGLAAEALFREVLEAFELLNDPQKRRIYDIHTRPHPVPSPGTVTHRRSSTETNVSGAERGDSASTTDEPRDHATRIQDRSEWTRQEAEAHRAWRAERTKSYSATPTPIKIAHNQYPGPTPTTPTFTPDTSPSKPPASRTTTPRATSHNSTFSYPAIPSSPPNSNPIKPLSNTPVKSFSSASSIKSFSTTSSSTKIPPTKSVSSPTSLTPTTSPNTTNTRSRSDTASTTYTNNSATSSTRSRSSTADSTSTNTTTTESIKSKSSMTSISSASKAGHTIATSYKPSTSDTDGTKGQPDATKQSVLGYEEWVERILAELYLMAPEWMNIDKNGPRKMDTNPV